MLKTKSYKKELLLASIASVIVSCGKDNFTNSNDSNLDSEKEVTVIDQDKGGITLNLESTFQMIDHFGASGGFQDQWVGKWPDASKDPIAKLLFSRETDDHDNPLGIGLTMWRTIIGDGAADQSNSGFSADAWFRETECFLNDQGEYDWDKQAGEQWFLSKARAYGVPKFTAWATTPPYFMTANGYTFRTSESPDGFNCLPANYDAYATFLADVMSNYESLGYNFETICPFNETQYPWLPEGGIGDATQSGTTAFNSEVAAVTRRIDQKFTEKDINAKIMIPEAAQLAYLFEGAGSTVNQVNDFFNVSSSNYIGDLPNISKHIAGHSYFSNNTSTESIRQRTSLSSSLASAGNGLDYWQTEYSLLGAAYQQGRDITTLTEIDYALWLSRIIHTDLVFGNATGWSFWTALNQSTIEDHPFRFNLIVYQPNSASAAQTDGTFDDVKNLWALGNYSRFVKPGMLRFAIQDSEYTDSICSVENFMSSGYINPNDRTIVLVFTNVTDKSRSIHLSNYGDDFEVVGGRFDVYTTSASTDLRKSVTQFDAITIPSKSITTLTATLK